MSTNPSPAAGPNHVIIPVEVELGTFEVRVAFAEQLIKPGDRVTWQFRHVPDAWIPAIRFEEDDAPFGPLAGLTQTAMTVTGTCATQPTGTFRYAASVQRGLGTGRATGRAELTSPTATLDVGGDDLGRAHTFVVRATSSRDDGQNDSLVVEPVGIMIDNTDTVTWNFEALETDAPEAWLPRVNFRPLDDPDAPNAYLGPFTSLQIDNDRVIGLGNNKVAGAFHFEVAIIARSDGRVLWRASRDPLVDNSGEPPGHGGG